MGKAMTAPAFEQYIIEHFADALEQEYIKVYYQPVIRVITRQVCSMEALARWDDPEWGLLSADKFIGILEKHHLIHELDSYVIRKVCATYRMEMCKGNTMVPVSVNLSGIDFELLDLFQVVEQAVQEYRMPREYLCIEITERALNYNDALVKSSIEHFQEAGYQVCMDDFGSEYSSLNVLSAYQFDELKIDMRFLGDLHLRGRKILASIVHMAKEVSIQTLAECVETEEQLAFLKDIGCEKAQGFLFCQPMPYQQCHSYLKQRCLSIEPPVLRSYYDHLGQIDVLSSAPFTSPGDQTKPDSCKELSSIPLSIVEIRRERIHQLFSNSAFDSAVSSLDWRKLFVEAEGRSLVSYLPLNQLSDNLRRLLEETQSSGFGKMYFVDNGEYYEIQAKRMAEYENVCSILLRLDNLSRGAEIERQAELDQGLRQIYSAYNRVTLLDLETGAATPLYVDSREKMGSETGNLSDRARQYADKWIFPEDREKYLEFLDPATIEDRVTKSGKDYISTYLRLRMYHGNFVWRLFMLMRIREGIYFLLSRDAETEIRELLSKSGAQFKTNDGSDSELSPGILWNNVVENSNLKFFWKDKKRRFLGASQSFLKFYGFKSLEDIIGKTDEEMGWHIHPDLYKDNEEDVIEKGSVSLNCLGSCIVRGENRNIIASKMPLYNELGEIVGLFGYFFQVEDERPWIPMNQERTSRVDALTGLLNARGIDEDLYAYLDEYDLRIKQFARINISIEDFAQVNRQYGHDFGDNLIRAVANALLSCCGTVATVGRIKGSHFAVLYQYNEESELVALIERIKRLPSQIRTVDGVSYSPYLNVEVESLSK